MYYGSHVIFTTFLFAKKICLKQSTPNSNKLAKILPCVWKSGCKKWLSEFTSDRRNRNIWNRLLRFPTCHQARFSAHFQAASDRISNSIRRSSPPSSPLHRNCIVFAIERRLGCRRQEKRLGYYSLGGWRKKVAVEKVENSKMRTLFLIHFSKSAFTEGS